MPGVTGNQCPPDGWASRGPDSIEVERGKASTCLGNGPAILLRLDSSRLVHKRHVGRSAAAWSQLRVGRSAAAWSQLHVGRSAAAWSQLHVGRCVACRPLGRCVACRPLRGRSCVSAARPLRGRSCMSAAACGPPVRVGLRSGDVAAIVLGPSDPRRNSASLNMVTSSIAAALFGCSNIHGRH
jgi:hypothetical protein